VAEVARHFADSSGHARTTILTVMERLRKKRYLRRRKALGRQQYSPTVDHGALLGRLVGDFVENVLGGSVSPFLAYLVDREKLTEAEARKLLMLIERIEEREKNA
jgi:BlaI family penicillinase repressor